MLFCACTLLDLLNFFNRLRISKILPFLFVPNANLNTHFQNCIAFEEVSMACPNILSRATHRLRTTDHSSSVDFCSENADWIHEDYKLTYTRWPTNLYWHLLKIHCTNSTYESNGRYLGGTTTYEFFSYVMQSTNAYVKKYIPSHVINYQHISIALTIIIGVALQKYEEYNNLPHWISGTTQC